MLTGELGEQVSENHFFSSSHYYSCFKYFLFFAVFGFRFGGRKDRELLHSKAFVGFALFLVALLATLLFVNLS